MQKGTTPMAGKRRRDFITLVGSAALWPLAARAQSKPARIAMLGSGAAQSSGIFVDALKRGLADNGLIEEQDYVLDIRWAEGEYDRFPALASEVVSRNPNVILATTIAAVRSAQRASVTIPIVMSTINDPVGAKLVASLARPGGNTTGIANLSEDLTPKVLEILRAIIPRAIAIGVLFNPTNPSNPAMLEKIRAYAGTIGVTVESAELKAPKELERVFGAIARRRPDALLVINDASILDLRARIMALALQHGLPVASSFPEFTDAGALVGYGPPRLDLYRRAAYYVKRILDGTKPADLPVEQPTRIELSVNLKTAKTLGIAIPDSFMARIDRVIE
jgi:putative ABC transport system substrate-binding protein